MDFSLCSKLQFLANKYEIPAFCNSDPSQFLRWYPANQITDIEFTAFIAAMLSFGNRSQFIPKIRQILEMADKTSGSISKWLQNGTPDFPEGSKKFYRFYSFDDMKSLFNELAEKQTLGEYFHKLYEKNPHELLSTVISESFPKSAIVPKGKNTVNKRIHMFLRWMVRQNSSVDLGIWDWYSPSKLLIPLDTHVMQEAAKLKLIGENERATLKTAQKLTEQFKLVFPNDPCRGDFALFGLGVSEDTN